MKRLGLTRWLKAAIPALALAVFGASPASATFVTSGNTSPSHLGTGTPGAVVAYAVYSMSGGSFGTGNLALEAAVASWGAPGQYLYLYSAKNTGVVDITGNGVVVFGIGGDVKSFGQTNVTGLVFGNLYSPANAGSDMSPWNPLGVTPTFTTAGATQAVSFVTPSSSALTALYIGPVGGPLLGTLAPGSTSILWGYTSDYAPVPTSVGVQAGTTADGTVLAGSAVPEPATVAMFATAIPFGLLYLKRRKAATTV